MAVSIFRRDGPSLHPTPLARGPWDPNALHGGAPAGLLAGALAAMTPGEELPIVRLSFEFLRPVPMAPLRLRSAVTRPGRRVQGLQASLFAEDLEVCRAGALRMLPAPEGTPSTFPEPPLAPPSAGHPVEFTLDGALQPGESFASAMEMRFLEGDPGPGPATVWMRLRHPLVEGEPLTPLMRLAAAADFGNGVGAELSWREWLFINADLTIQLRRAPRGEWMALQARTVLHPGGHALAESVLHDEEGPVARAMQSLLVARV